MSLSIKNDLEFRNNFYNYYHQIENHVEKNKEKVKRQHYFSQKKGVFSDNAFRRLFTFTGAFQVKSLKELYDAKYFFLAKNDRFFKKGNSYILRGPRYLAAIDPMLSIPQKLSIYIEDLHESLSYIQHLKNEPPANQFRTISPVLDYSKNCIITLTNAYLHKEKRGMQDINDPNYDRLRQKLMNVGIEIVYNFYMSIIGEFEYSKLENIMNKAVYAAESACDFLLKEYADYKLSSRDIVRPEASHPLVLISTAALMLSEIDNVDTVIGLPSGGTEFAYLIYKLLLEKKKNEGSLLLLPISLHSMLTQYGQQSKIDEILPEYMGKYKSKLADRKILLVDDNSSTGSTLETICSAIKKIAPNSEICVGVTEADIIRSKLDLGSPEKRTHHAHPEVYKYSVSILPVSKYIWRKHDLKEVNEAFLIGQYYAAKAKNASFLDKIKAKVFCKEARSPFERITAEPDWNKPKIEYFRGTFLSNFYEIRIPWRGKIFPSVEHAYQSAKFDLNVINKCESHLWQEAEKIIGKHINSTEDLFVTESKPSSIKKVAKLFKDNNLMRDNWDEIRVDIMIELLVKKFSHQSLRNRLLDTNGQFLIEGNDWGDTFWGATIEKGKYRGRNILGLIIMTIREEFVEICKEKT